ncbi:metal-dependent hydrolase [Shimazuella sp. AN120528]|uniref:metal-dependent hydrolase n=1 Tax=Shimazuella soli TaxID=1892854 RepID=UPI001F0D66C6|nr:metal-dependent hydrolase [Shimazuella soli]MCH5584336.1 metal-dependent hydrolase [Shimazuella soli]
MKITYHGQSCIEIHTNEYNLIIDPFLTGNPLADITADQVKVDYVLLTHGHGDHLGDTIPIAKKNNAKVIAPVELATWLSWQGLETYGMNIGGSCDFPFGRVKLTLAHHSSSFEDHEKKEIIYLGNPAGFLLQIEGKIIYHAGDTSLFSDMKLIGMQNDIDIAFLPIGDYFTMGPEDALIAAEWIDAKQVVPIHYNTFPVIEQDASKFITNLRYKGLSGVVLQPGESING